MSQVILITGAANGIGRSAAFLLRENGHEIIATDQDAAGLEQLAADGFDVIEMDVRDAQAINSGIQKVVAKYGKIDSLVANAGHICLGMLECVEPTDARDQFDVNFFGAAQSALAAVPMMRAERSGRIIFVSSIAGKIAAPGMGWYCASKHALEGFADALRMEVKRFGIEVSLIEPGFVKTNLMAAGLPILERARKTRQSSIYAKDHENFESNSMNYLNSGEHPDVVAKVIQQAIEAKRPKLRYKATQSARFNLFASRWLPGRFFDSQILRQFLKKS